ncbi:hypothetical protein MRX96_048095 [Rhipicephalus microplus]
MGRTCFQAPVSVISSKRPFTSKPVTVTKFLLNFLVINKGWKMPTTVQSPSRLFFRGNAPSPPSFWNTHVHLRTQKYVRAHPGKKRTPERKEAASGRETKSVLRRYVSRCSVRNEKRRGIPANWGSAIAPRTCPLLDTTAAVHRK